MKLHLTEDDLNNLHRAVTNRRSTTKRVEVEHTALFDLLRDYAQLYQRHVNRNDEQAA